MHSQVQKIYIYKKQDRGEGRKKKAHRYDHVDATTPSEPPPLWNTAAPTSVAISPFFSLRSGADPETGVSHKNKLVSVFNTFYHNKMSKSEVEFVPVPESCTVRRVVVAASAGRSSRRRRCNINNTCCNRTSSSLIHLTSRKFFFLEKDLFILFLFSLAGQPRSPLNS